MTRPRSPWTAIIGCSDADTRDRGVAEWRREHGRNVLALCEALRIAVEGLDVLSVNWWT